MIFLIVKLEGDGVPLMRPLCPAPPFPMRSSTLEAALLKPPSYTAAGVIAEQEAAKPPTRRFFALTMVLAWWTVRTGLDYYRSRLSTPYLIVYGRGEEDKTSYKNNPSETP